MDKLASPTDKGELETMTTHFVRQRIRELAAVDKIMPPESIDPAACQRSVQHEGLTRIIDIEPRSSATILSWRSGPDAQYLVAPRAELAFFTISSKRFEKYREELLSYEMPLTKVIEDNTIRDIHEKKDAYFFNLSYSATSRTGQILTQVGEPTLDSLTSGLNLIDSGKLATGLISMAKPRYNKLLRLGQASLGSQLAGDVFINGLRYPSLLGHALVVSTKSDLYTRNPYGFGPKTVENVATGFSPVLAFTEDSEAHPIPYDPGYPIGTDLITAVASDVGGVAGGGAYGTYPASAPGATTLLNGMFVAGVSPGGSEQASTTNDWLGNTILYYTRADYLGRHYTLQDVNFYIDQRGRMISWEAWVYLSMGIVNNRSVGQLTFQSVLSS
jgi:hypothetical protein